MAENNEIIRPSRYFEIAENDPVIWGQITGQRLTHKIFGEGTILNVEFGTDAARDSYLLVKFDNQVNSIMNGLTDTVEFGLTVFSDGIITNLSLPAELIKSVNDAEKIKLHQIEEAKRQYEIKALTAKRIEEEKRQKRVELEQKSVQLKNEREEINNILNKLIKLINQDISKMTDLRKLNDTFHNHNTSNYRYSDEFEQRAYLLRYFYAYYYEYRNVIKSLSNILTELNVVSIGCGAGIDAVALKNASNNKNKKISYIGIDCEEWERGIIIPEDGKIKLHKVLIKEDSNNYLKDATVLFFPRSLSDIERSAWQDIKKWIKKSDCTKEKICIAASFIYIGQVTGMQYDRYNDVIGLFEEKGYILCDSHEVKIDKNAADSIWNVDNEIFKPSDLIRYFNVGIANSCIKYKNDKIHCHICKKTDEGADHQCRYIYPKLKAKEINYRIKTLVKQR